MGISLTHPQRQSRQHAYSDRDIAYLEKQGWVREKPPEPALLKSSGDSPVIVRDLSGISPVKRGRPRKP